MRIVAGLAGTAILASGGGAAYLMSGGPEESGDLTFAFWNVRDLTSASRDDGEVRHIATVAERYDLIVMAEVGDDEIAGRIASAMGPGHWSHSTTPPTGDSSWTEERYSVLWRTGIVDVVSAVVMAERGGTDREPARIDVRTTGGGTLSLVVAHVRPGDTVSVRDAEIRAIGTAFLPDVMASEDDVVLMCDCNRNLRADSMREMMLSHGMIDASDEDGAPTTVTETDDYDHALVPNGAKWVGSGGIHRFDEELFGNDDEAATLAVSNHRPVWFRLIVGELDPEERT